VSTSTTASTTIRTRSATPISSGATEPPADASGAAPPVASPRRWLRLVLLAAILVGLYIGARSAGWLERFDLEAVRAAVSDAGALGIVLYVLAFALGVLLQVPGMVFVGAAVLAYGRAVGYVVALGGAIFAVCLSFAFVRAVGGQPLGSVQRPFIRRLLARLEAKPIRTLAVMRVFLFISPPVTYALALSSIRFRDYAAGSALGLVIPTAVVTWTLDWVLGTPWVRAFLFR
jgi:uncharacterized membrane protein YdjX (TVP38/TMEM64 family)